MKVSREGAVDDDEDAWKEEGVEKGEGVRVRRRRIEVGLGGDDSGDEIWHPVTQFLVVLLSKTNRFVEMDSRLLLIKVTAEQAHWAELKKADTDTTRFNDEIIEIVFLKLWLLSRL